MRNIVLQCPRCQLVSCYEMAEIRPLSCIPPNMRIMATKLFFVYVSVFLLCLSAAVGEAVDTNSLLQGGSASLAGQKGSRGGGGMPAFRQEGSEMKRNQPDTSAVGSLPHIKLADDPRCGSTLRRLCDKSILNNNFAVLDCLQNKRLEETDMSPECHSFIWQYKYNLTQDDKFGALAKNMCKTLLEKQPSCREERGLRGHLLSCLMENMENATDRKCHTFLTKMEAIVFSDFRLIYKFAEKCSDAISRLSCGRVESKSSLRVEGSHTQGSTIECLSKQPDQLDDTCRHEILRIAELQSDDFHLDRPLFFACREDRERLCPKVQSGEGRVYRCLMRHKMDRDMSQECREKLNRREKLVVHDYKISRGLSRACRDDIRMYHCRDETSDRREIRLAQILLCLENAMHKAYPVAPECQAEMLDHRRALMENYQLTPELAAACEKDIDKLCGKRLEGGGKTLHCLMDHARVLRHGSSRIVQDKCRRQLEMLMKEVDVGEDWRVDPVLKETCQPVVDVICSDIRPGEGKVLQCLLNHIDSDHMSDSCKETLLQIQYFVARDFKLDPTLYKVCHEDAERHCHAKKEWYDKPSRMDPERGPMVLQCLYRYAYHPDEHMKLSSGCLYEIRRVMRQRAVSVDLQPDIEEPCMNDLAEHCSSNLEKGQEMSCLQEKLEQLSEQCRAVVGNYTAEESEHIELNYPLYKACESALKQFCKDFLTKDVDQGDLLQCLTSHKNHPDMKKNAVCRTGVEHFQLLALKDFRFNFKFKESCKKDVLSYCKSVKTKYDVVACLSGRAFDDALSGKPSTISQECKNQLKVELLQRAENILLDPDLNKACKDDQQKFCKNVSPGESQVIQCLKDHQPQLSKACHKILFSREKEEMQDNTIDYALMNVCKSMINKYCLDVELSQVLYCLKSHRDAHDADPQCRSLIMKRLIEQNKDYRLNIRLKHACSRDIPKFCKNVIENEKQDEEFEGKVIACLKQQYRKQRLSKSCEVEVVSVMRDEAQDYYLDPILVGACKGEIERKCSDETNVEECLKIKFQNKELTSETCKKEVARLIFDGKADIQSDPLLYKSCALDLKNHCLSIVAGHGRQLSCLLAVLETESTNLTEECKTTLTKRVEMFEYAAQVAPAESIEDLVRQVTNSPARNYFAAVAICLLGFIFLGGLFCGRVTRRVPSTVKNK